MIGKCRSCGRMVAHDEARCPYCGAESPVERPWEPSGVRRARPRPWPRALRRWGGVVVASLALIVLVSLCSAGPAAPGLP